MGSREKILQAILGAKTGETPLLPIENITVPRGDIVENFIKMVASVGGKVLEVSSLENVRDNVDVLFPSVKIISTIEQLPWYSAHVATDPHAYEDIDLAIIEEDFWCWREWSSWITDSL